MPSSELPYEPVAADTVRSPTCNLPQRDAHLQYLPFALLLFALLQDDLVEAAQQEVAERRSHRKHRDKLHKAKQQEAASVAQDILQVPAGFAQFTARILQLYKQHGIEWPTVTLEFKHMNVTTKVWG